METVVFGFFMVTIAIAGIFSVIFFAMILKDN